MLGEFSNAPVATVLGLAFTAGAVGLASLAAPSTMTLTRTESKTVTVTVETRLFNRYRIGGFRIDGVESMKVVESTVPPTGTGPDSPFGVSIYFVTREGPFSYGVRQKLFDSYVSEMRAFFAGDAPVVTFSVNDPGSRLGRFIVVHLAVLFMSFIGLSASWTGLKGLFSRTRRRSRCQRPPPDALTKGWLLDSLARDARRVVPLHLPCGSRWQRLIAGCQAYGSINRWLDRKERGSSSRGAPRRSRTLFPQAGEFLALRGPQT